jgi:hypothetical protein
MMMKRSLGGIGALYRDGALLGKVYYNFKQEQRPGVIVCTLVFVGDDVDLPRGNQRYRLWLEDGQYLILTLQKTRPALSSPYIGISCDGVFHSAMTYVYSASDK